MDDLNVAGGFGIFLALVGWVEWNGRMGTRGTTQKPYFPNISWEALASTPPPLSSTPLFLTGKSEYVTLQQYPRGQLLRLPLAPDHGHLQCRDPGHRGHR